MGEVDLGGRGMTLGVTCGMFRERMRQAQCGVQRAGACVHCLEGLENIHCGTQRTLEEKPSTASTLLSLQGRLPVHSGSPFPVLCLHNRL